MSGSRLITVFGATGAQGRSVVASLLQNKTHDFAVRAITRNPESGNAKALKAQGAEVVKADGFNKDEVVKAFTGSWGVFVNTNSDDPAFEPETGIVESTLGKIVVDAAIEAKVEHFVYSGLVSAKVVSQGEVSSTCFDEKAIIMDYVLSKKEFKTVNITSPAWYTDNHLSREMAPFLGGFPFITDDEGYLTLRVPRFGGNDEMSFINIESDFGDIVHGVFLDPEAYDRQLVQGISVLATPQEFVDIFQKITGKKSRFVAIEDWKTMETYNDSLYISVREMFGFCQVSGGLYFGEPNTIEAAKALKVKALRAKGKNESTPLESLEAFVSKNFSK